MSCGHRKGTTIVHLQASEFTCKSLGFVLRTTLHCKFNTHKGKNWCEHWKNDREKPKLTDQSFQVKQTNRLPWKSWKDPQRTLSLTKTKPWAILSRWAQTKDLPFVEVSTHPHLRRPQCGLNHGFHFSIYLLSGIPVTNRAQTEFSLYSIYLPLSGFPIQGGTPRGALSPPPGDWDQQ